MKIGLGIIGLGTIGRFVLEGALQDKDFEVKCIYDINPPVLDAEHYRDIEVATSVDELLDRADIDLVYISTPPATHIEYCNLALDKGKALWCEKPLATNLEQATALVQRIEAANAVGAVNLSLATSPILAKLQELMDSIPRDDQDRVEMQFRFSAWPRHWQKDASGWLSGREQGGFLREVFSHFVFMHHRLIGPLALQRSEIDYPSETESESQVYARYLSGNTRVTVHGAVGGNAPDLNDWTLYTKEKSIRFSDWDKISIGDRHGWVRCPLENKGSVTTQLAEVKKMMAGQTHRLASFKEALEVQRVVEFTIRNADSLVLA
ncbi:Gfo/Idh/MocA family oxidoreductase [Shewanella sp. AS16]|uniref:Gfo/Idh/MocA family protein n=1 Tax=Shewanella sp. AS16 TaxID=2907625 RepID=UPI001F3C9A18|nr:Gfo/Idh/MocA family oxidoreductase [Shewanella sp. AS16]MCE9685634.1 Gfo/Idh/MocA family oxidoreductase [Shewanella sp. AS16]